MSCVLHISGDFSKKEFLDTINLTPYDILEKGERSKVRKEIKYDETSCMISVSEKGFDDLDGQILDTINFLELHAEAMRNLSNLKISDTHLDFGIKCRLIDPRFFSQTNMFPAKLLKLAGNLNIDIVLSEYKMGI